MAKLVRVQFELPQEKLDGLRETMMQTGIKTTRELVDNALACFLWAVREVDRGMIIASVDEPNRKFREFTMPSLESGKEALGVKSK